MMNYTVTIKKHSQHRFHIGTNLLNFFGSGWSFLRPIMKNVIMLQYHRCKPKFHHLWRSVCTVDKIFTDTNMISCLIFTQQVRHKFGSNLMDGQVFSENLMTCGFWNSIFLFYFINGHTIGMDHFLNFLDVFFIFFMLKVILKVHCPQLKYWPSLKCLYHSWVCVLLMVSSPNACFNILKVSKNIFPTHENHPFLNA